MEWEAGLRALVKLLVLPPGGPLLLIAIGLITLRRGFGRLLIAAGVGSLYLFSTPAFVDFVAARVEAVPPATIETLASTDADLILVFMAGAYDDNPELGGADIPDGLSRQRLDHAVLLQRRTGLPMLLSGGAIREDQRPLAAIGADWLRERHAITVAGVDDASRNTWENARLSAERMRDLGYRRALLVTHAFHMPRALYSAEVAGLEVIPAPFGYIHTPAELRQPGEMSDWLPHASSIAASYLLLHEALGLAWYRWAQD